MKSEFTVIEETLGGIKYAHVLFSDGESGITIRLSDKEVETWVNPIYHRMLLRQNEQATQGSKEDKEECEFSSMVL